MNSSKITPQQHLDTLLQERGYDIPTFETLQTAYYNQVTDCQTASYGPFVLNVVRGIGHAADSTIQYHLLQQALECGLSANACNKYGESLLHLACRRGNATLVRILMDAGNAVLQISDDYGRTLMHDACWTPNHPPFELIQILLSRDPTMLFMKDCRGSLPLSYIQAENWDEWNKWLDLNIHHFFPNDNALRFRPSHFATSGPNSIPTPPRVDKKEPISLELMAMVACGKMSAKEVLLLVALDMDDETTLADTLSDGDSDFSFCSSDYADLDSDFESDDETSVNSSSHNGTSTNKGEDEIAHVLRCRLGNLG